MAETTRRRASAAAPADPLMAAAEAAVRAGSLVEKLTRIALAIGEQDPEAFNKDQKFDYYPATQVYGWWREKLHQAGIIVIPQLKEYELTHGTYKSGTAKVLVSAVYTFAFRDGTEEIVFGPILAQGEDSSDKGAGKALTYAFKQLLLTMGMTASMSDDNEDDGHDRVREKADRSPVKVEDSNIEGIQRGGRSTNANDVQIRRLRDIYQKKELTFEDAQDVAKDVLGEELELDAAEGAPAPGQQLLEFFKSLSSEDIGKMIVEFEKFDDPEETAEPS